MTSSNGQLNPDWVEWLMRWPIGYTDAKRDECGPWTDAADDPADLPQDAAGYIPRVTERREFRTQRVFCEGNGQEPLCAAISMEEGLWMLEIWAARAAK